VNVEGIEERKAMEMKKVDVIHDTALAIRKLLDDAALSWTEITGEDAADEGIEDQILDLVTGD